MKIKSTNKLSKGKIIFLNGVTSTGKTTLAKEIQAQSIENFYHISNDIFQHMVSIRFIEEDYRKYLGQAIIMMYRTAAMLSNEGINVIIDGMLLEREGLENHYETMKKILSNRPLTLVEVLCPLEECKKRNIQRGNRRELQSHEQNEAMTKNIKHDISVNTYLNTAEECAKFIIFEVFK